MRLSIVQTRTAEEVKAIKVGNLGISVYKEKNTAYLEADNLQRSGWTILSIHEVKNLVTWDNDTVDKEKNKEANGVAWVVIVQK